MHLGVAIWKDKCNCNYNRADIWICLVSPPRTSDMEKKKHFNTTQLQSPSNTALRSQVKPLCLHLTSKTNTAQFGRVQTPECERLRWWSIGGVERKTQKQAEKWNGQNPSCSRAIWMFTCWIFYQFCFYLSPPLPLSVLSMQQVLSYALGLRGAD